MMRATLVKSAPETRIDLADAEGEGNVQAVLKRKKSGTTTYYHDKKNLDHPFLATIEAVSAHLMRLIFGSAFTPKGRVYQVEVEGKMDTHFLSKSIALFTPAAEMHHSSFLDDFISLRKEALSKIILTVLCFQEPDLHQGNWGFDYEKNQICHFDHDKKWVSIYDSFVAKRHYGEKKLDDYRLFLWPNLIYNASDVFSIITPEDILNSTVFNNLKPFNDPFLAWRIDENDLLKIEALSKDPDLRTHLFYYLTKFLLLLTPERVRMIIEAHSVDSGSPHVDDFFNAIMAHQARIKKVLLFMPEYRFFFQESKLYIQSNLRVDFQDYNTEFCDAKSGIVKPEKMKYTLQEKEIKEVFEALKKLNDEVEKAVANDTVAAKEERAEDIAIACLVRSIVTRENVKEILKSQLERQAAAKKLYDSFSCGEGQVDEKYFNDFFSKTSTCYALYEDFVKTFFSDQEKDILGIICFFESVSLGVPYETYAGHPSVINAFSHFIAPFRAGTTEKTIGKKLEEKRDQFTQNICELTGKLFLGSNANRVKLKMMKILRQRNISNDMLWGTALPDYMRPVKAPAPIAYDMWQQRSCDDLRADGNGNAANVGQVPGMFGN